MIESWFSSPVYTEDNVDTYNVKEISFKEKSFTKLYSRKRGHINESRGGRSNKSICL